MRVLRWFGWFIFVVIALVVIVRGSIYIDDRMEKRKMLNLVRSGELVIDQETHDWTGGNEPNRLEIELYMRNKGSYRIDGKVAFLVRLDGKGLEEHWMNNFILTYTYYRSREDLTKYLNRGSLSPKNKAIRSFIERGSKLAKGKEYEPVEPKEEDYHFIIYKHLSFEPKEIIMVSLREQIPPAKSGFLFNIDIAGFGEQVWREVTTGDEKAK